MCINDVVYLDNAATTYPKPEQVYVRMDEFARKSCANAGRGGYALGWQADACMERTRGLLKELFHAGENWEVIFSASATFAMNQILFGIQWHSGDVVYVSPYEHNAVMRPLQKLEERCGVVVKEIPLDKEYKVDTERLAYGCATDHPRLVCVTAVSNVTGYILPVAEIAAVVKAENDDTLVVVDASQAAGLVSIDVRTWQADALVFAGHKTLYGPFGVGGIIAKREMLERLDDYLIGGTGTDSLRTKMPQEIPDRFEASSHNTLAIAGLETALEEIKNLAGSFDASVSLLLQQEQELRRYLYDSFQNMEHVSCYPAQCEPEKYTGILSFAVDGYEAEDVGDILDEEYHIAVRTGYHCAPLIHKHLHSDATKGTVRVSVGRFNNREDIDALVKAVKELQ